MKELIKVERIEIVQVEGSRLWCDKLQTAQSWEQANSILSKMAGAASEIGYDKTEFTIYFEDGTTYSGRYDLKHISREQPDLSAHVVGFVRYHGGLASDSELGPNCTREQYDRTVKEGWLKDYADGYVKLFNTHDLGPYQRKYECTTTSTQDVD